jgi:hypothetical protein
MSDSFEEPTDNPPCFNRFSTAVSPPAESTILRGFLIGGTVPLPTGTAARVDGKTGNGGP